MWHPNAQHCHGEIGCNSDVRQRRRICRQTTRDIDSDYVRHFHPIIVAPGRRCCPFNRPAKLYAACKKTFNRAIDTCPEKRVNDNQQLLLLVSPTHRTWYISFRFSEYIVISNLQKLHTRIDRMVAHQFGIADQLRATGERPHLNGSTSDVQAPRDGPSIPPIVAWPAEYQSVRNGVPRRVHGTNFLFNQ